MNSRIKKLKANLSNSEALIQSYRDQMYKARSDSEKMVYEGWIAIELKHIQVLQEELESLQKRVDKQKQDMISCI